MKIYDIFEKIDDMFYKIVPNWFYCFIHRIFNFRAHKQSIKLFFQRLIRGWDDTETWSLDDSFYKWLQPRLKRFIQLTMTYPMEYESYIKWIEELQYRVEQLDKIIEYKYCEYDFPNVEYFNEKTIMKMFNVSKEHAKSLRESNPQTFAYLCYQRDFMNWYAKNINNLWW